MVLALNMPWRYICNKHSKVVMCIKANTERQAYNMHCATAKEQARQAQHQQNGATVQVNENSKEREGG